MVGRGHRDDDDDDDNDDDDGGDDDDDDDDDDGNCRFRVFTFRPYFVKVHSRPTRLRTKTQATPNLKNFKAVSKILLELFTLNINYLVLSGEICFATVFLAMHDFFQTVSR